MKLYLILLILAGVQLLSACGETSISASNGFSTKDPLATLAFNSDVLNPEPRFASYSSQSARASIIDPDAKKEVWGFQANNYDFAIPHSNYDGITLFSTRSVNIVTQSSNKLFEVVNFDHIAVGTSGINFALSRKDGSQIEVIRFLGDDQWQQELIDIPWQNIANESSIETQSSRALVSFYSEDSNTLYIFNPLDGKYQKLTASNSNSPLQIDGVFCDGNGNIKGNDVYRTITFDEINNLFIAGDGQGKLTQIQLGNGCHDYANSITHQLANNEVILNINVISNSELIVTQYDKKLFRLDYSNSQFIVINSYESLCPLPIGSLILDTDKTLITCLPGDKNNYEIDKPYYQVFSQSSGDVALNICIHETFTGVGIDVNNMKLHRMLDSSLGVLQTFDLTNGAMEKNSGIFLSGLLD